MQLKLLLGLKHARVRPQREVHVASTVAAVGVGVHFPSHGARLAAAPTAAVLFVMGIG